MTSNGNHHGGGRSITVLYKITNSESDGSDPLFNAFQIPYGSGPTLASVKQRCAAAHALSDLGPEGYHWRVMVEDRPGSTGSDRSFSWWDIQDANAKLPVKETSQSELRKLFHPKRQSSESATTTDTATKAAKGAFKMMGKAMSAVAGDDIVGSSSDPGPSVAVLAFKLLDMVKIHDDFANKQGGGGTSAAPAPRRSTPPSRPAPRVQQQQPPRQQQQQQPAPTPQRRPAHQQQVPHQQQRATSRGPSPVPPQQQQQQYRPRPPQQQQQQRPQEASLMDFGDTPSSSRKTFNHSSSLPAGFGGGGSGAPKPPANETRAQKLQREYKTKNSTSNRVWDPIDERWVEVDPATQKAGAAGGTAAALRTNISSAPPGSNAPPKKKEIGISLDPANAVGKTANVQAAVNDRVNAMKESQAKALQEVREREAQKKKDEDEEDTARRALEPKIKAWSEEHGQKKQLRALLASLHTILWPGATWKVISIGDILDDGKVKRFYHKATLVVHPDKTHHLPPDQRFLAKRIFDALSQAKTEFDNGPK